MLNPRAAAASEKSILAENSILFLLALFSFFSIAGTQIALGLALLIWLIRHVRQRDFSGQKLGLEWLLLAIFAWGAICSAASPRPLESFTHMKHLLLLSILYLLADSARSLAFRKRFVAAWLTTGAVVAAYGLALYLRQATDKVIATQSTTMTWGAMLVPPVAIAVALLLFAGLDWRRRLLLGLAILLLTAALFFSLVRGAYVGLATAVGIMLLLRRPKLVLAFAALLLIAFFLSPAVLQQRILSIFDLSVPSTQVRLVQWQHALEMIRQRPIFGFGWIDLAQIHRQMVPLDPNLPENVAWDVYNIGHFHNNLVMWMMNWGIPGLVLVLAFFARLAQRLWQSMQAFACDRFMSALALGVFAALAGYFVNGFFDWTFGDAETVTILWISLGLALQKKNVP